MRHTARELRLQAIEALQQSVELLQKANGLIKEGKHEEAGLLESASRLLREKSIRLTKEAAELDAS